MADDTEQTLWHKEKGGEVASSFFLVAVVYLASSSSSLGGKGVNEAMFLLLLLLLFFGCLYCIQYNILYRTYSIGKCICVFGCGLLSLGGGRKGEI